MGSNSVFIYIKPQVQFIAFIGVVQNYLHFHKRTKGTLGGGGKVLHMLYLNVHQYVFACMKNEKMSHMRTVFLLLVVMAEARSDLHKHWRWNREAGGTAASHF